MINDINTYTHKSRYALPLIIVLAGLFIAIVVFIKDSSYGLSDLKFFWVSEEEPGAVTKENKGEAAPTPGELGSDHAHANLFVIINNNLVEMAEDKYMLKNEAIHLENSDGLTIHKHATGITVSYFLSTLGFKMSQTCLSLDTGEQFCNTGGKKLSMVVNGAFITDFSAYEIAQGDQVLVNYGSEGKTGLLIKFNNIPPVPKELQ